MVNDEFDKCKYCNSSDVIEDRRNGEVVCRKCGTVQTTFVLDDRQPLKKRKHNAKN